VELCPKGPKWVPPYIFSVKNTSSIIKFTLDHDDSHFETKKCEMEMKKTQNDDALGEYLVSQCSNHLFRLPFKLYSSICSYDSYPII